MADIGIFTPEQARQLWHDYLSRQQSPHGGARPGNHEATSDLCVILDDSLAVATDAKTGATSGDATVCEWDVDAEEYNESDPVRQITVYNHSESTAPCIRRWWRIIWAFRQEQSHQARLVRSRFIRATTACIYCLRHRTRKRQVCQISTAQCDGKSMYRRQTTRNGIGGAMTRTITSGRMKAGDSQQTSRRKISSDLQARCCPAQVIRI
jgi:hypothetical protein